ncbi:MAG: phosphodiester glycosidase family protein [Bacteroidota bacterium]
MKKICLLLIMFLLPLLMHAQNIVWEDVSSGYEFPEGLKLFHGTVSGNDQFFAYYYEVDMNVPEIAVRPYLSTTTMQVNDFSESVGAYGAVNGGFFSGSSSVSSVVFPNEVPARNLISVNRTVGGVSRTYPVIRSLFALNNDRSLSTEWVYHHSYSFDDIYLYNEPLQYTCDDPDPLPVPLKADGNQYEDIAYGLGGGPLLVKNGEIVFTYCEEIWWGSGVDLNVNRPRTVVGYTADDKVILLVTNQMKVEDLPQLMLDLGCVGAMNLDGGGSTAMAAGETSIFDQNRPVPTILAIVHSDSLTLPQEPTFEKFIDTEDEGVTSSGEWFPTANDGYWETPSMLHGLASDDEYYEFPLGLTVPGEYEIYSWWTAHANRSTDTPHFITHADGVTEVAVNQSIGGSMWNYIGTFQFNGTPDEKVRITAGGTTNQYVVADAIRVVSYDPAFGTNTIATISGVDDISVPFGTLLADALAMLDPQTTITDTSGNTHMVDITWQAPDYQSDIPGDYTATGSFELPQGVEQTTPPTPLEVQAIITVLEDDGTTVLDRFQADVSVFPNPAKGVFTARGKVPGEHAVQILDLDGTIIYQTQVSGTFNHEINLVGNPKGVYILRISGKAGVKLQKLIIQ